METNLVVFEGINISVLEAGGKIWFRSTEVGKILEIANTFKMVKTHCHEWQYKEWKVGMGRPAVYVTESGLYRLILNAKTPIALKFQDWVTDEVLPTIRKKGVYATDEAKETIAELVKSMVSFRAYFDARRNCTSDRNDPLKKLDTAKLAKLDDGFEMAVYELCEILGLDPDDFSWSETDDIPALHKLYDEVEAAQSKRKRK